MSSGKAVSANNIVSGPIGEPGDVFIAVFGNDQNIMLSIATGTRLTIWDGEHRFHRNHHARLQPGMVISMEPMLTIPDGQPGAGGYREHDILIITEDGNENITGFPYGPAHNIIG